MVVATDLVAIGQGGRVGHGTRDESCDGEETQFAHLTCNETDDDAGNDGDEESIEHPPVSSVHDGVDKSVACSYAHYGEEQRDTYLTYHLIGRRGGIGHQLHLRAILTHKDRHDERTTCQAEFHGHEHTRDEDGNGSQHHTQGDAKEERSKVGLVGPRATPRRSSVKRLVISSVVNV